MIRHFWRRILYGKIQHFALQLSPKISRNDAPAKKSGTPTSPNIGPATKSYMPTSLQLQHMLPLPQKLTQEHHQMLRLPRKKSTLYSSLLFSNPTLLYHSLLCATLFSTYIYIYIAPEKMPFAPKGNSWSHRFSGAIHINLEGSSGIAFPSQNLREKKILGQLWWDVFPNPKKMRQTKKLLESAWQGRSCNKPFRSTWGKKAWDQWQVG